MKTPESGKDTNVLRKTPEEIKKGLECCGDLDISCEDECPYFMIDGCLKQCKDDVLAYIQQLEFRLAQVEREREAAVNDLSDSCQKCKFVRKTFDVSPCEDCFQRDGKYPWSPMVRTKFEWRGVCPGENT